MVDGGSNHSEQLVDVASEDLRCRLLLKVVVWW